MKSEIKLFLHCANWLDGTSSMKKFEDEVVDSRSKILHNNKQ